MIGEEIKSGQRTASAKGQNAREGVLPAVAVAGQIAEAARANAVALFETGKVLKGELNAMGEKAFTEGRDALALLASDLDELATATTPAAVMELQQKLARRNAELMLSGFARSAGAFGKLASEMSSPFAASLKTSLEAFRLPG